jgi:altronate hydrolase
MSIATDVPFLFLHEHDDIAVARHHVSAGISFPVPGSDQTVTTREPIELGHKVAVQALKPGDPVRKFGQVIGFATQNIEPGSWVHTHNMGMGELSQTYEIGVDVPPPPDPLAERFFQGIRRPDGRAATRNYLGIISTVNCSATASKWVADAITDEMLADYPNIDGIVALTHKGGCAFEYGGEDHRQLARTMAGFARHPNIGAYLVIGLGCEASQPSFLVEEHGLVQLDLGQPKEKTLPVMMTIQEQGGVAKTVDHAIGVFKDLLPQANQVERTAIPASELILGTECGGSDGNSGVTANPAVGHASDLLVALGGTAILAEVPEMYGAEHMLVRRAVSREVGEKLIERIRWWEDYARKFGVEIDNNPSVGNKKGGLTTIYEKSLGAVAKGGTTALRAVYEYAEQVTEKGFVIMDTPGFDPPSVTGMVAGGANIVVFTTGRGSCFGCKPVPTIKVASNTPMYERMQDDMDINAGRILQGATVEEVGEEILEKIISVASGEKTKSEAQGIGDEEFCPWVPGPVL